MQKALRGLETGLTGFNEIEIDGVVDVEDEASARAAVVRALGMPTPDRILVIAQAFRHGLSVEEVNAACSYEPWFLRQIADIVRTEGHIRVQGLPTDATDFRKLKSKGFSDARLAQLTGQTEKAVRTARRGLNVRPVFKRIDTCAAEFASATAYMYSTYETGALGQVPQCESNPTDRKKAIILGGGPNRIGQGIEFDYCCCHAAFAFADIGVESIMVNCNPETVSTDYDTSDRLYFEPLTAEDVLELIEVERSTGNLIGVVVQFGGQTPLKLAHALHEDGVPILGTSLDSIDLAEDRERFQVMLHDIGLMQPPNGLARSAEEAAQKADEVGYPVVLRPSYVLGGRGMVIVHDREQLDRYVGEAMRVSGDDPVLIDHYLNRATEVDVDALCDDETVFVAGVLEHIEEAGVHSGDSACRAEAPDRGHGPGPEGARPDERPVRHRGAAQRKPAHLRAGSEPARIPHGTLRGQDHRAADRVDRRQGHGRGAAEILRPEGRPLRPYRGQGSRLPLRPLRRGRHHPGPRDAVHRRGHGSGLEA